MIAIIEMDGSLHLFTGEGMSARGPHACICDACDIDCDTCQPGETCYHHREGSHGICVSRKVSETEDGLGAWERVAWFRHVRISGACACQPAEDEKEAAFLVCPHLSSMHTLVRRDTPGRVAGALRARVTARETTGKGLGPESHKRGFQ